MISRVSALAGVLGVGIVSPAFWAILGAILSLLGWLIIDSVRGRKTAAGWRDVFDVMAALTLATMALLCLVVAIAQVIAAQG